MESPDWESPPESPWTCDQPWKGKFDRIARCIGALGGAGFEVQELQESGGAESRHTRGHLDGSLGTVGSDRSGGSPTDEQYEVRDLLRHACGGVGIHRVPSRFKNDRDQGAKA